MIKKILSVFFLGISTTLIFANQMVDISVIPQRQILAQYTSANIEEDATVSKPKFQKLKTVLLTVFLGHFGVHRIYLGTTENVPVVYSATLGGGLGLLPLLDLIAILSSKDLEQFKNNNKVFMWSKKSK